MDTMLLGKDHEPDDDTTISVPPVNVPELQSPHSVVIVFADNSDALQFELLDTIILGRRSDRGEQPEVDLAPFGGFPAGVSRIHVRFTRLADGIWLDDLKSVNGTFINDEQLVAGTPKPIANGQRLQFGTLKGWAYFNKLR